MYTLLIIEWQLLGADNLIGFVTLACNDDNVACRAEHHGGLYSVITIDNLHIIVRYSHTRLHIAQNLLRILAARVVGGENCTVGKFYSYLCHLWALCLIPFATTATNDSYALLWCTELGYALQDVFKSIRSVSIVNNSRCAVCSVNHIKSAIYRVEQ